MSRLLKSSILLPIIAVIFGAYFSSCTDTSLEVIELHDVEKEEEEISYLIDSRVQVYDAGFEKGYLFFKLYDKVVRINSNVIPCITIIQNRSWAVNGIPTETKVQNAHYTSFGYPVLSITPDDYLMIGNDKTSFKWDSDQLETLYSDSKWVWAISIVDNSVFLYKTDNSVITIPINRSSEHIFPGYFFDNIVTKERMAEKYVAGLPNEEQLSYVFFTDAHWGKNQKHSPAIIKHIVDYTPIDIVLFGGDVNTDRTQTIQETLDIGYRFKDSFSFLGSNFYCLFGNHDDNSTGQAALKDRHLSEEQVFSYLQQQMTNAHYWDYYNFYFDDEKSKTRFICLDTGRLYEASLRGSILKTAKFTIECLYGVPEGWHIIAASHIWTNLNSFETGETRESAYVRPIIEILENYNLRNNSRFLYGDETIEYDFSNAGAVVDYCIGGHTHSDYVCYSQKGLPLITVSSDGQKEVAGSVSFQTGTINEQCVTIIVNDYINRMVKIYHIGRGADVSVNMWESQ